MSISVFNKPAVIIGGSSATLSSISISSNGTYSASAFGVDGFNVVDVDVQGGGGDYTYFITGDIVEITLPKNISKEIKGDLLFIEAMQISPNFKFKYANEAITIMYFIKKDDKHFLYYIVPLLEKII